MSARMVQFRLTNTRRGGHREVRDQVLSGLLAGDHDSVRSRVERTDGEPAEEVPLRLIPLVQRERAGGRRVLAHEHLHPAPREEELQEDRVHSGATQEGDDRFRAEPERLPDDEEGKGKGEPAELTLGAIERHDAGGGMDGLVEVPLPGIGRRDLVEQQIELASPRERMSIELDGDVGDLPLDSPESEMVIDDQHHLRALAAAARYPREDPRGDDGEGVQDRAHLISS